VLAPVQIAVKPISRTRCQPDANSEQKQKKESHARLFESELSDPIVFQSKIKLEERYLCF